MPLVAGNLHVRSAMNYLEDHTERIPKHYVASSYLEPFLNPASLAKIARASAEKLQAFRFEAIAFRGVSGALIAPVLSIMMGKKLVCVRKPDERSHSDYPVEGAIADLGSYVIVDDFMASGETARHIIKAIYEQEPHARCIGLFEARYAKTSQFNILRSLSDIGWQYPAEGLPEQEQQQCLMARVHTYRYTVRYTNGSTEMSEVPSVRYVTPYEFSYSYVNSLSREVKAV